LAGFGVQKDYEYKGSKAHNYPDWLDKCSEEYVEGGEDQQPGRAIDLLLGENKEESTQGVLTIRNKTTSTTNDYTMRKCGKNLFAVNTFNGMISHILYGIS